MGASRRLTPGSPGAMKTRRSLALLLALLAFGGGVAACGEDDVRDAGQDVENTAEDAAKEAEDAAEDAGDAAQDAGNEIEEQTDGN